MLLNEPTPHSTRPAAVTAAAVPGTGEMPAVEVDGALAPPRANAEADTVSFGAVNGRGKGDGSGTETGAGVRNDTEADPAAEASAGSASGDGSSAGPGSGDGASAGRDKDAISTVALDVEAVKRAVAEGLSVAAPDVTSTVSLDVEAVKRATASQAPTVAFSPVDRADAEAEAEDRPGSVEAVTELKLAEAAEAVETIEHADPIEHADDSMPDSGGDTPAATATATATAPDSDFESDFDSDSESDSATASADLVPSGDTDLEEASTYLASTVLLTQTSTIVAVPETADDVIATIHAAATAVAAADRRARQAAVVKEDPWTDLDLHRPGTPAPVGHVLDLLAPVLERPLLVVEQPGLPAAADVVALHRSELEQDFVEPPVVAAGAEPPIPPRFGPGLSVLPHIEFPV